jgi:hypothetical protein
VSRCCSRDEATKTENRSPQLAIRTFLYVQPRHVRLSANQAEQIIAIGLDATGATIPATGSRLNLAVNRKARHPARR